MLVASFGQLLYKSARSKRESNRAVSAALSSGATRPLPLGLKSKVDPRGNGRVAPLKNAALTALFALRKASCAAL